MLRRDMTTLLMVNAGLHPPFLPSYRMSRHTWPLLQWTTHRVKAAVRSGLSRMCALQCEMDGAHCAL